MTKTPQTPWKLGRRWRLFGTIPTDDDSAHTAVADHISGTGTGFDRSPSERPFVAVSECFVIEGDLAHSAGGPVGK